MSTPFQKPPTDAPRDLILKMDTEFYRENNGKIFKILLASCSIYIFFVSGLLQFYLGQQWAYQLNYIIPILLLLSSFASNKSFLPSKLAITSLLIALFYIYVFIMSIIYARSIAELIMGFRIYGPTLLTFWAIAMIRDKQPIWNGIEKFLLWFPIIQFPFVAHQHFAIAPARIAGGETGWDSVVGTMGGSMMGGGDNGGLALMCCCSILTAYYLIRSNAITIFKGLVTISIAAIDILLGEVKIITILFPAMLLIQRGRSIYARPVGTFLILASAFIGSILVAQLYNAIYWSNQKYSSSSIEENLSASLEYVSDTSFVDEKTGEVSRAASWALWLSDEQNQWEHVFGYGPGSTRGPLGKNEIMNPTNYTTGRVAERYKGLDLGATGISQLLWDFGIFGSTIFIVIIVFGILKYNSISNLTTVKIWKYRYRTASSILFAVLVFMIYNKSFVDIAAEQFILGGIFGLLVGADIDIINNSWRYSYRGGLKNLDSGISGFSA